VTPTAERRNRIRGIVVDANDGIVATAGIVEGFIGAGADTETIAVAVVAAMVGGSIALASAKYAEISVERDAAAGVLAEERRQLALSPDEELAELAALYEAKGLSPALARQVAEELSRHDAVAAHAELEHGLDEEDIARHPVRESLIGGAAFALGAFLLVLAAIVVPSDWRLPSSVVAVGVSLAVTSVVLARWGRVPVARTVARTVTVGLVAMAITFLIGTRFHL
jgi:VIT1/CCC1 family predicted Fe2+/Mn2+ transporter